MIDYFYSKALGEDNNYLLALAFCDNYVLNRDVFDIQHIDIVENFNYKKKEIINNFEEERIKNSKINFIISSEHLSARILKSESVKDLKKFLENLNFKDIKVCIYFRNIFEYIYSLYYTHIEGGGKTEFTEFICSSYAIRNSNYYNIYRLWSDVFENTHLYEYKKNMNTISHFIQSNNIKFNINPDYELYKNITNINEIENLNSILIEKKSNFNSLEYTKYKYFMSPDIKELISSLFYPNLHQLGKEYFNDQDIFLK